MDAARLNRLVGRLLGSDADQLNRHALRAFVLEQATLLEIAVSQVLAAPLAVNIHAADQLTLDVFSRISMRDRLPMLRDMMEELEVVDRWPFMLPVLERVSEVRNRFAHGFLESEQEVLRVTTWNRGRVSERRYPTNELAWLAWQIHVVSIELVELWAYVVPSDPRWHLDSDASPDGAG